MEAIIMPSAVLPRANKPSLGESASTWLKDQKQPARFWEDTITILEILPSEGGYPFLASAARTPLSPRRFWRQRGRVRAHQEQGHKMPDRPLLDKRTGLMAEYEKKVQVQLQGACGTCVRADDIFEPPSSWYYISDEDFWGGNTLGILQCYFSSRCVPYMTIIS